MKLACSKNTIALTYFCCCNLAHGQHNTHEFVDYKLTKQAKAETSFGNRVHWPVKVPCISPSYCILILVWANVLSLARDERGCVLWPEPPKFHHWNNLSHYFKYLLFIPRQKLKMKQYFFFHVKINLNPVYCVLSTRIMPFRGFAWWANLNFPPM